VDDAAIAFNIDLDRQSPRIRSWHGILRSYVRALQASNSAALVSLCLRTAIQPIKPKRLRQLSEALEGWKKGREASRGHRA